MGGHREQTASKPLRCRHLQDLEQQFEAAANLIAKGTPSKGSASTDETRQGNQCSHSLGDIVVFF